QRAAMAARQASAAAQIARAAAATLPSAERGAAIARTTLTTPEAAPARAVTPPAMVEAGTATSGAQPIAAAATADVRVAEALGLRTPIAAVQPIAATPVARATTPLGRALAHAAWVDTQLRVTAPAARAATPATAGYVF